MFSLDGRTAFVTGGGGGLGSAICSALAEQGAQVAVADRDFDAATKVSAAGERRIPIAVDVTSEESVRDALDETSRQLGPIDVLVHCAGIGHLVRFEDMTFEDWRRMLSIHLDGAFLCARYALPAMLERGWGRIICVSSIVATSGVSYEVHYAAAKAGIEGMVRALAREVASRGVTANAIAPGYFDTPLNDLAPDGMMEELARNIPLGRLGYPSEIGALAAYLASGEAAYLTGQVISPNGCFSYGHADQQPI